MSSLRVAAIDSAGCDSPSGVSLVLCSCRGLAFRRTRSASGRTMFYERMIFWRQVNRGWKKLVERMARKQSGSRRSGSSRLRAAGRPRIHSVEAYIGILHYVGDQRKRTGLSLNKILKYGVFVQVLSGSSCAAGPDRPTVLHVLRGANLRRRYHEARAWFDSRG
jgi:hypothetical protein